MLCFLDAARYIPPIKENASENEVDGEQVSCKAEENNTPNYTVKYLQALNHYVVFGIFYDFLFKVYKNIINEKQCFISVVLLSIL